MRAYVVECVRLIVPRGEEPRLASGIRLYFEARAPAEGCRDLFCAEDGPGSWRVREIEVVEVPRVDP